MAAPQVNRNDRDGAVHQIRATFLTVLPSPYTRELFAAMNADGRIKPRVLYRTMTLPGFDWGNQSLRTWEQVLPPPRLLSPGQSVSRELAAEPSDVFVVSGYASLTMQVAMRWLHRSRVPWVFFGERPAIHRRSKITSFVRPLAMRPALRWPKAIAAAGSAAVREYRQLCLPSVIVRNLPYYTDLSAFRSKRAAAGGSPHRFRLLYCGQLIERKGVRHLIRAFIKVAERHSSAELLIVGDGPLRPAIMEDVPIGIRDRIRFAGFRAVDELPELFSSADAFVLPSLHDGWGVVVNQAMGAGLPIIATDAVGAALDLVRHGENGLITRAGDTDELRNAIEQLASNADRCRQFGEASYTASAKADLPAGVDGWFDLLSLVQRTSRKASHTLEPVMS